MSDARIAVDETGETVTVDPMIIKAQALSPEHRALLECHVLRRDKVAAQGQAAQAAAELAKLQAQAAQDAIAAFVRRLAAEYDFDAERDSLDVASGRITRKA